MDGYITDEEQIEHLKKWWAENGKSIIGGIIIGLTAVFGWRGWQDYLITRAEAASDIYQDMIVEIRQEKNAEARKYADELLNDYSATTYAVFASFMLAKLDSDNNNLDSAISHLQWVLDNTDEDEFSHGLNERVLVNIRNRQLPNISGRAGGRCSGEIAQHRGQSGC